jgi:hypothetical protein
MSMESSSLLKALIATTGRLAFPQEKLTEIICSKSAGAKQIKAFNLCDGTRSQAEIIKECKLDAGNFSRTVGRWVSAGVLFRIGEGKDAKLLHIYPYSDDAS